MAGQRPGNAGGKLLGTLAARNRYIGRSFGTRSDADGNGSTVA